MSRPPAAEPRSAASSPPSTPASGRGPSPSAGSSSTGASRPPSGRRRRWPPSRCPTSYSRKNASFTGAEGGTISHAGGAHGQSPPHDPPQPVRQEALRGPERRRPLQGHPDLRARPPRRPGPQVQGGEGAEEDRPQD